MAKGKIVYIASTNLEPIANVVTSMGQSASKKDKPDVLANKIKAISTDATGVEAEMLVGKTFYAAGQKKTGTMPNRGAANATLNAGGSYVIPQGYHNGSGKVTANSLASQTLATATAAQILSGQTAWVNGNKITGSMSSKGAQVYTPSTVNQTIGAGQYLSGVQTISGDPNLLAKNIKSGVKIFGVTGTLAYIPTATYLLKSGVFQNSDTFVKISALDDFNFWTSSTQLYIANLSSYPNYGAMVTNKEYDLTLQKRVRVLFGGTNSTRMGVLLGVINKSNLSNITFNDIYNKAIASNKFSAISYLDREYANGQISSGEILTVDVSSLSGNYVVMLCIRNTYHESFYIYIKDIYFED